MLNKFCLRGTDTQTKFKVNIRLIVSRALAQVENFGFN